METLFLDECVSPKNVRFAICSEFIASGVASDAMSSDDNDEDADGTTATLTVAITQAVTPAVTEYVMTAMDKKANYMMDALDTIATKVGERLHQYETRLNALEYFKIELSYIAEG